MFNKLKEFKDKAATAKKLMDLQKKIAQINVEGAAGWGKVKVTLNGLQQMLACNIDPEVLKDPKKLETLICEATNDAVKKLQQVMAEQMKEMGGGDLAQEFGEMLGNKSESGQPQA